MIFRGNEEIQSSIVIIMILVSKPVLQKGIPEQYHVAGTCARSCFEEMCGKLQSGEVTIEDLNLVRNRRDLMKRLCSAVSSGKMGHTSYKSVEASVAKRVEECEAVRSRIEVFSHLCHQIRSVSDKVQGM